jgi:hypothetical protein
VIDRDFAFLPGANLGAIAKRGEGGKEPGDGRGLFFGGRGREASLSFFGEDQTNGPFARGGCFDP